MSKNKNNTAPAAAADETAEKAPTKKEKEALFEAYVAADTSVELAKNELKLAVEAAEAAARGPLDAAKAVRSEAIKAISAKLGNGPFDYQGKILSVVKRIESVGEGEAKREVTLYNFKSSKQTIQKI